MNRSKFISALIATVGFLSFSSTASSSSLKEIVDATYKLYHGDRAVCSGQFVKSTEKQDLFLTAAHCISRIETKDLKYFNVRKTIEDDKFDVISEHTFYLKPVRTMQHKDVTLLETTDPKRAEFVTVEVAGVKEANEKLEIGQEVFVVGFPKTKEITYTHGEFTGKVKSPLDDGDPATKHPDEVDSPLYRTTVPVTGGSSGGGLYLKDGSDYKLIGLTTGGYRDVGFMNYFSTVESINEILKNHMNIDTVTSITVVPKELVIPVVPDPDAMEK